MTPSSPPNHDFQSAWLMTATRSSSAAVGSRPRSGRAPSVVNSEYVGGDMRMRSTRSPARIVDVNEL